MRKVKDWQTEAVAAMEELNAMLGRMEKQKLAGRINALRTQVKNILGKDIKINDDMVTIDGYQFSVDDNNKMVLYWRCADCGKVITAPAHSLAHIGTVINDWPPKHKCPTTVVANTMPGDTKVDYDPYVTVASGLLRIANELQQLGSLLLEAQSKRTGET